MNTHPASTPEFLKFTLSYLSEMLSVQGKAQASEFIRPLFEELIRPSLEELIRCAKDHNALLDRLTGAVLRMADVHEGAALLKRAGYFGSDERLGPAFGDA